MSTYPKNKKATLLYTVEYLEALEQAKYEQGYESGYCRGRAEGIDIADEDIKMMKHLCLVEIGKLQESIVDLERRAFVAGLCHSPKVDNDLEFNKYKKFNTPERK